MSNEYYYSHERCHCSLRPDQLAVLDATFDFDAELGPRPWKLPEFLSLSHGNSSEIILQANRTNETAASASEATNLRQRTLPERHLIKDFHLPCPALDSHAHTFPPKLMKAVQSFFNKSYWPPAYKGGEEDVDMLLDLGVTHVTLVHYAHKAGISRGLNEYIVNLAAQLVAQFGPSCCTPLANVFPGEPDQGAILAEAFIVGCQGVKLHAHVQYCRADDFSRLQSVYETCVAFKKPILFHAGSSPNIPIITNSQRLESTLPLCHPNFVRTVLEKYPDLVLIIPHIGSDETDAYVEMLDQFPNLYLDTTMTLHMHAQAISSGNLESTEITSPLDESEKRTMEGRWSLPKLCRLYEQLGSQNRLLCGTDFPNFSHNYHLEYLLLLKMGLSKAALEGILFRSACKVYGIDEARLWERYWSAGGTGGKEAAGDGKTRL